jgi:hypothetical protein
MDSVKSKSLARGLTIGAVEGLTLGLSRGVGSAIYKSAKAAGKTGFKTGTKISATTTGVEMAGGGTGETLGTLAAGQELKGEEIFLETIGEARGVVNTADIVKKAINNTSYKLNGEEVAAKTVRDLINNPNTSKADLAKMNIEVTGDAVFDSFVRSKQKEAVTYTQVHESVTDIADRNALVDLSFQRDNAIADTKKEGASKVPNAKAKLEDIESQIDAIINKYEGAVDVAATEEAATARKGAREASISSTVEFAESAGKLIGKDVKVVDDTKAAVDLAKKLGIKKDVSQADGFIAGDAIVINKDVASRSGAISVGSHEILHGIMAKHMSGLSTDQKISCL